MTDDTPSDMNDSPMSELANLLSYPRTRTVFATLLEDAKHHRVSQYNSLVSHLDAADKHRIYKTLRLMRLNKLLHSNKPDEFIDFSKQMDDTINIYLSAPGGIKLVNDLYRSVRVSTNEN